MPNLFETSPHVIDRITEAMEAIRNAVGSGILLNYVWAGLFHPARRVRQPYWRLYNDAYVQSADSMGKHSFRDHFPLQPFSSRGMCYNTSAKSKTVQCPISPAFQTRITWTGMSLESCYEEAGRVDAKG